METALSRFPLNEAALTREVAIRSTELDLSRGDPADRLLAATALVHGLTLLTLDEQLLAAGWLPTRSE
jgi:PIN domain nuclease of toxin-antitoxin system